MKRILALVMALYFLATSVGFGVTTHYCQGRAIKSQWQLVQHEISCGMKEVVTKCADDSHSVTKPKCCANGHAHFQLEENAEQVSTVEFPMPEFVIAFVYSFIVPSEAAAQEHSFLAYSPPQVQRDITILQQVFRI